MRAEYDFSKGKRGALIAQTGKTRITIHIDNGVLDEFRTRAQRAGAGYQTMINEALKAFLGKEPASSYGGGVAQSDPRGVAKGLRFDVGLIGTRQEAARRLN